jgi:hypothetical protein
MLAAASTAGAGRRRTAGTLKLMRPAALLAMLALLLLAPADSAAAQLPASAVATKKTVGVAVAAANTKVAVVPSKTTTKVAAATPAAAAPKPNTTAARAARANARLGDVIPNDPSIVPNEADAQLAIKSWSKFADAFPRFISNISIALERGRELARQPIPAKPTNPIVGDCVPFRPPAPYRTMQQYAKAISGMTWQQAERMFRNGKVYKGGMGIRGCAAGVIVGDNLWASLGRNTPLADTWSGKCIDEDPVTEEPYALTNAIAPFIVNKRDWIAQRVPGDKLGEATVSLGTSWLDGQAAWVLSYAASKMMYGFDFRDIRDEIRVVEPGMAIGTVYAIGSNDTHTSAFNPSNSTLSLIYFVLLQNWQVIY